MSMALTVTVATIETGETEQVRADLVVLRQWETQHGKPAIGEIQAGFVGPILEVANLAHNRKHGRTLSVDDWAELYEVVSIDAGGSSANPSSPATTPPTP